MSDDVVGRRVRLVETTDPYTPLEAGDEGVVTDVDEDRIRRGYTLQKVWVDWDRGGRLALIDGEDEWEYIEL